MRIHSRPSNISSTRPKLNAIMKNHFDTNQLFVMKEFKFAVKQGKEPCGSFQAIVIYNNYIHLCSENVNFRI